MPYTATRQLVCSFSVRHHGMAHLRPIFCGNFEYDAAPREIERLFERYGTLDRVDMKTGDSRLQRLETHTGQRGIQSTRSSLLNNLGALPPGPPARGIEGLHEDVSACRTHACNRTHPATNPGSASTVCPPT